MTLTELNSKIAASPHVAWYQKYSKTFDYSHINYKVTLTGVSAIYQFILNQITGFDNLGELPQELKAIQKRFTTAKSQILTLISNGNVSNHTWDTNLEVISHNNNIKILVYEAPETEFLVKLKSEKPKYYEGAYNYITGSPQHLNDKNHFIGNLLAYEFTSKEYSILSNRKDAEENSINKIRSDFQTSLGNAQTDLTKHLSDTNKSFSEHVASVDKLKKQYETLFTDWFEKTSTQFKAFNSKSLADLKNLEDLYQEKLKLEAPAQYWKKRAVLLKKEGQKWLWSLVASIGISTGILIWILYQISNGTLNEVFKNTASAIKWSIVLITIISLLAFVIRIFSKLTFSAYHLVRDAEEREQLTYVYLALQNEKGIDKTERHLIMQSLFSRADSGLLKEDGAPTMPGNIMDKVIK